MTSPRTSYSAVLGQCIPRGAHLKERSPANFTASMLAAFLHVVCTISRRDLPVPSTCPHTTCALASSQLRRHRLQRRSPLYVSQHSTTRVASLFLHCHMLASLRQQRAARACFVRCFTSRAQTPYSNASGSSSLTSAFGQAFVPLSPPAQTTVASRRCLLYIARLHGICLLFDLYARALSLRNNIAEISSRLLYRTTAF